MNSIETNEFSGVTDAFESIKNTLESFENKFKKISTNYFHFCKAIAYIIFQNVGDNKILEAKFKKYMQKYKTFCNKYAKFIAFRKISVFISQEDNTDWNEDVELVFNYEENREIIDRHKINEVVETLCKYGRSVNVKCVFYCEVNESFKNLKKDLNELNEMINNNVVENSKLYELEKIKNKILVSFSNHKVLEYFDDLAKLDKLFNKKCLKYTKKYLYKCVLKQQTNFVYEGSANQSTDCAVC